MSEQNKPKFIGGLYVTRKDQAPDYVLCNVSFSYDKFVKFMVDNVNEKGYLNVDIKRSKNGKIYAVKNDWKPNND